MSQPSGESPKSVAEPPKAAESSDISAKSTTAASQEAKDKPAPAAASTPPAPALLARAGTLGVSLVRAWPTAAAIVCGFGLGWAGAALRSSDADSAAAKRAADLDARIGQMAGELRALRDVANATAAKKSKPAGDELKSVLDRMGALNGAIDRVERQDRDVLLRLTQLNEKVERLEKASAPLTTASVPAAPKPALDHTLPKPDPKYVARPVAAQPEPARLDPPEQQRVAGWSVREVVGDLALLENNRGQLIEIALGERLRELGYVRKIERRGRKWVVVTEKGVIE